jgi:RNA polymerase sigma-70 factor (ECF subfamily)
MEPSDNELISRARLGEVVAFEQLVHRYDRKVLSIASLYTRNEEDAKDIYQEAFLRVYRGLAGFRGKSQFSTWLYRVVTNVCLSHKRKHQRVENVSLESSTTGQAVAATAAGGESPEKLAGDTEISRHVAAALEKLPDQQRLVFILRHFQDLKLGEIADMMNCAEGTVKRYLYLAIRKLRVELEGVFESQ